ncbi:oxidoreductase-like protein [Haematococcus lacustris]
MQSAMQLRWQRAPGPAQRSPATSAPPSSHAAPALRPGTLPSPGLSQRPGPCRRRWPLSCRQRRCLQASAAPPGPGVAVGSSGEGAGALPGEADVVVVGAGVAGLAAALKLQAAGLQPLVLEAGDGPGGRVRTDKVEGFLLDRGFQIFLTGYPEAQAVLDYPALRLHSFYAGALVRWQGAWHRVADPLRHPVDGVASLVNPVGSVADKLRVGLFRLRSTLGSQEALLQRAEMRTLDRLKAEGFSEAITRRFFRPFLGGIFFDRGLSTSSRLFEFVMRMLATGSNCLPEQGIGAVALQMAGRLEPGALRLNTRVLQVEGQRAGQAARVRLAGGGEVAARRGVVVAVEGPEALRLLGPALQASPSKPEPGVGTCCLYFAAPRPALPGPLLYLSGEEDSAGPVNNACFPSEVCSSYAPPGQTLCSVSTVGTFPELSDAELEARVREQLAGWWGAGEVAAWRHLRTYRIPYAQPNQTPPTNFFRPVALGDSLFCAGDHRGSATLDGALVSGRMAAEAVLVARDEAGARPLPAQALSV